MNFCNVQSKLSFNMQLMLVTVYTYTDKLYLFLTFSLLVHNYLIIFYHSKFCSLISYILVFVMRTSGLGLDGACNLNLTGIVN